MGFNIGSAISSAFTPPGQHAAQGRDERNSSAQQMFGNLLNQYGKLGSQQIGFANSLEPQYESNLLQGISGLGESGTQAGIREFGNGANERAAQSAQSTNMTLRSQGYNPGSSVTEGANNAAQAATNQFAREQSSAQAKAQRASMALQFIMQGMSPSSFSGLSQLGSGVYGQPAPYVGKGIGDYAGQLAGMYASGGKK